MSSRKIWVCAGLFLLIVVLGGVLNSRMAGQQMSSHKSSPSNPMFTIYSSYPSVGPDGHLSPFLPREYVRIIHRAADE